MLERNFGEDEGERIEEEEIREQDFEVIEVDEVDEGIPRQVLRREPSFSRWCDENRTDCLNSSAGVAYASAEDSDFELPLLRGAASETEVLEREGKQSGRVIPRIMNLRVGHAVENFATYIEGNENGNHTSSFGIEKRSSRESFNGCDDYLGTSRKQVQVENDIQSICVAKVIRTLFFIAAWYTFSTLLTLYNKTLLGDNLGKFPAPFLMNTIHFTMQAVFSKVIIRFWLKSLQPAVKMSWRDYFIRVVPTAIGTALDINLSNISLVFISVTFATMCKSASPIFLLIFAFAFKLESPSVKLLGIIFIISIGILLTVVKETEFELWGFIFVMLAAVMSGFRWSMTQILLQKEAYGLKHPLTLMCYVTPVMAVGTAILSFIMDPWLEFGSSTYFNNSWHILRSCLLLLLGGLLAFLMVLTEYVLVSETSAVTVMIAGVVKETVTILVAVFYFQDKFTFQKGVGLIIIMIGVGLFNWYKYEKLQNGLLNENHLERGSHTPTRAAKYVILENMDNQDDDAS